MNLDLRRVRQADVKRAPFECIPEGALVDPWFDLGDFLIRVFSFDDRLRLRKALGWLATTHCPPVGLAVTDASAIGYPCHMRVHVLERAA